MKFRFLILFVLIVNGLFAQDSLSSFIKEKDLTQFLYYYDLLDHTMLPHTELEDRKKVNYLTLTAKECEGKKIKFTANKGLSFFIDGALVGTYQGGKRVLLPLDSFQFSDEGKHLFSFYDDEGIVLTEGVWLVEKTNERQLKQVKAVNFGIGRFQEPERPLVYVVLVLVFVVLAYLRFIQSPYVMAYFDATKFTSRVGVEDFIILNPFSWHSLILLFLVSLFYSVSLSNLELLWAEAINVVLLGVIVFFVVVFKYVFVFLVNLLFGERKLHNIHFFEFVRFYSLFGFLFLLYSNNQTPFFTVILFLVYGVWLLWLLLVIVQKSRYRKMYLISYLCISEIFPIFILIKQMGDW